MAPIETAAQDVQTVIFLDVDGVLNVGIHDEGKAPLLLRDEDVKMALKLSKRGYRGPEAHCVAKLSALAQSQVGYDEDDTFEKLMTKDGAELSDVLVQRLAELIKEAGENCQVVLSSSWRRPHHRNRRKALEQALTRFLGKAFEFQAVTAMSREEKRAADRLETVGDYLAEFCGRKKRPDELRVLMLEDFFITPMDGWLLGSKCMDTTADVERYLEARAKSVRNAPKVVAKLCHCYDEITAANGLTMQVGSGLTQERFLQAKEFVSSSAPEVSSDGGDETPPFPLSPLAQKENKEPGSFMQLLSAFVPPVTSMVRAF